MEKNVYFTDLYNSAYRKFDHILPEIILHKHGAARALWTKMFRRKEIRINIYY